MSKSFRVRTEVGKDQNVTFEIKQDFDLYSTIMNQNGIISIHDTDENYWKNFSCYYR